MLWRVLLGAAHARWRLADLVPLLPTAPGLEHARTARRGSLRAARGPAAARRLLSRQWSRAVTHAAATSPAGGDDPTFPARAATAVAAVHAAQARADAAPGRWARPGGPADRLVLDALCGQLLAAVRADVELDIRRLGDLTGVCRETARRALHRLAADGWTHRAEPAAGVHAARWSLAPPHAAPSTTDVDSGVSQALPRPGGELVRLHAWRHRIGQRLAAVAQDVFTPTPGLGHHAARVYAALGSHLRHRVDLLQQLGYPAHLLDRYLDRLAAVGLARHRAGLGSIRGKGDLNRVAREFGCAGTFAARRRRHHLERRAWAWWLDELAWMRLPRAAKPRRRDPAAGQQVLALPGLTIRQRLGPHPRRPGGRAGYAAARATLTSTRRRVATPIPA